MVSRSIKLLSASKYFLSLCSCHLALGISMEFAKIASSSAYNSSVIRVVLLTVLSQRYFMRDTVLNFHACIWVFLQNFLTCYSSYEVQSTKCRYQSDLATERERQLTTARAAKIPARNWVDNTVAFCLKCDLARYTTPSCQFLQVFKV